MHANCILNSAANFLNRNVVFFRKRSEVSYSISSLGLGSFFRVLLTRSSSHRHNEGADKMSVCIILTLEASMIFLSFYVIISQERAGVV